MPEGKFTAQVLAKPTGIAMSPEEVTFLFAKRVGEFFCLNFSICLYSYVAETYVV